MEDSGQTEVEVELYEEIVDLNYSTPMSRAPSHFCYQEDISTDTTFQEPIISSIEREVGLVSASTGLVASVPWPALRSQCSLAGNCQEPRSLRCSDGNRATVWPSLLVKSDVKLHGKWLSFVVSLCVRLRIER